MIADNLNATPVSTVVQKSEYGNEVQTSDLSVDKNLFIAHAHATPGFGFDGSAQNVSVRAVVGLVASRNLTWQGTTLARNGEKFYGFFSAVGVLEVHEFNLTTPYSFSTATSQVKNEDSTLDQPGVAISPNQTIRQTLS